MRISILIPAFNEGLTLPVILKRVQGVNLSKLGLTKEIIVIDDGSADDTRKIIEGFAKQGVKIVRHEKNLGKGAAIQSGFKSSTGEIILIQDADLEYDPADYERLLQPIINGLADVVYGSRFVGSAPHRVLLFWHYLGNKIITLLTNIAGNLNLTDIETGFKVFRREALNSITLTEKRFGFEPEVTIKLAKKRWRFYEIGIAYHARDYKEGKKITWLDGLKAVGVIIRCGGESLIILLLIIIGLLIILF